jgi:hypothetical protein
MYFGNIFSNISDYAIGPVSNGAMHALYNTFYNCGSATHASIDNINSANWFPFLIKGNIIVNSPFYGLRLNANAGMPSCYLWDGNAFFGNSSGPRSNIDDGIVTLINIQNSGIPFVKTLDVLMANNPFFNAQNEVFLLNDVLGGGASCRGSGNASAHQGFITNSDFGALQMKHIIRSIGVNGGFGN